MAYIFASEYASDDDDVTSHTGIIPEYEVGDLLVWIVHKDSTTGTHLSTPDDWTLDVSRSDVNEVLICHKTAEVDEVAPTTSSDDDDAYQSTMLSVKGCSGIGEVFSVKDTDGVSETTHAFQQDNNSSIGGVSVLFASWVSTGGGTISPIGYNLINEESSSLAMTINIFPINSLDDTPVINLQSSVSRTYGLYQFELLDDGNGLYGGSVWNDIAMVENCIDSPNKSTTGNLSITTINGVAVDDTGTVIQDGYTDKGVSYIQKAVYVKMVKGTFFSGVEFTFTDNQDFQTNNPLFLFNVYTDRPKFKPPIGNGTMGLFMYLKDSDDNYKVWNIDSADASVTIITQDRSFVLDLTSSTFMDSSGVLDLSNISKIGFGQNTRSINASYFDVSRMYLMQDTLIYGGSTIIPANLLDLLKFQTGSIMNAFFKQGTNILTYLPINISAGRDITFVEHGITLAFPKAYDLDTRYLNYHCADNVVGVTFDITASSTVLFTNCTFTGQLKYYFNSASSNGVIDFKNTTFENVGNNQLTSNMNLTACSFLNCDTINLGSSSITDVVFTNTSGFFETFSNCSNISFKKFSGKNAIIIPASVTDTITLDNFTTDGSGTDVYWQGTSDTLVINAVNGTNITTFTTDGGDIEINNSVTITITVIDAISKAIITDCRVFLKDDDDVLLFNELSDDNGKVSMLYNYSTDISVTGRVRKASGGYLYKTSDISGAITRNGLDLTIQMIKDT